VRRNIKESKEDQKGKCMRRGKKKSKDEEDKVK
jgi:hypothetical protein